jgi:transcriptional regulator with XRE-family HTH domain
MLRKKMGLTQQALGRLLGISEQAIQRWERGVHVPRKEHLESLITLCLQRHIHKILVQCSPAECQD